MGVGMAGGECMPAVVESVYCLSIKEALCRHKACPYLVETGFRVGGRSWKSLLPSYLFAIGIVWAGTA